MAIKTSRLAVAVLYLFGLFAQPLRAQVDEADATNAEAAVGQTPIGVVPLQALTSPLDGFGSALPTLGSVQISNLPSKLPAVFAPAETALKKTAARPVSAAMAIPKPKPMPQTQNDGQPLQALRAGPDSTARPQAKRPAAIVRGLAILGRTAKKILFKPSSLESDDGRADFTALTAPSASAAIPALSQGTFPDAGRARLAPAALANGASDGENSVPTAASAAPNAAPPAKTWHYLAGVFMGQVANNALQVALPLVLLKITSSLSTVGFATAMAAAMDAAGTLIGGRLAARVHPKKLLAGAAAGRALTLALIPAFWAGGLGLAPILGVYMIDSLIRGVADTARNTMPMALAGKGKTALDGLNSRYQTAFESGGLLGPFVMGGLLAWTGLASANWMIPVAFAAAAAFFLLMPRGRLDQANADAPGAAAGTFSGSLRLLRKSPVLRLAMLATLLVTVYPLKGVLPALFAKNILGAPDQTAWLVGAFGLGGVLGSLLYGRLYKKISAPAWLKWGAAGVLVFAAAMAPHAFLPMALGCLFFAVTNVMARVSVASTLQSSIPQGAEGPVMGLARFSGNMMSVALKFGVGLAFAVASPSHAFLIIGAGLAAVAAAQLWLSRRLTVVALAGALAAATKPGLKPAPSLAHGLPGRIIVVEGLDGSGKSTQMEMLKESLESQGLNVVTTRWNSSELVADTVKKAKRERTLTPASFAALNAADLTDRIEKVILPALREGSIVLSDRYFYTALARDSVRGNDPDWLRQLYASAIRPDLTFYFRLPVETAIGRVLARTEDRLKLSEDFGEDNPPAGVLGQNYYAAGRDMDFSADDAENFRIFQGRVAASYDAQSKQFGFQTLDARQDRESLHQTILTRTGKVLGPLSAYKRKNDPAAVGTDLFDKNPADDPENIRENYQHPKRGVHFYFRNMLLPMQERFAQLMDHSIMPRVFLHGSPHIDNYAKSAQGAAMVDFDRSRYGPYAWDLSRLMVSVSLRRKKPAEGLLHAKALRQLKKGYLHGLRHPNRPFSESRILKDKEPKEEEVSTNAYLKADKSWTQEMRADSLPPNDPRIKTLLDGYLKNRGETGLLKKYFVEEAGRGRGSMAFRDIFLLVLAPKNPKSRRDRIFLNFKQVRSDPDTRWYTNPFPSDGQRMLKAGALYAPGWELRPGYATLDGVEYHVRQIQPQNAKIKKMLDKEQQEDFVYAVGTQLGRAHGLSAQDSAPKIEEHLETYWDDLVAAALVMRDEIAAAHARYLEKLEKTSDKKNHGS